MEPDAGLLDEVLPGGNHTSVLLRRGYRLRLTDLQGGANVSLLAFNFDLPGERYNMADTLKAQHVSRLAAPLVLYSDMGRVLLSMTVDTCGWHDTICGTTDGDMIAQQYGALDFQNARNERRTNGRDSLLVELGRWGGSRRDLVANLNLFSKVAVDDAGDMTFVAGHSQPGSHVDLRAEMNVVVVLSATPHPLDPATEYPRRDVHLSVAWSGLPAADDPCRTVLPENARGFENSQAWFEQTEQAERTEGGPR